MKVFVLTSIYSVNGGAYLSAVNINTKADRTAPVNHLRATYEANKKKTVDALKKAGISGAQLALAMVIRMQETRIFNPADYDHSKTGDSTNYSAFNFNRDMLVWAGVTASNSLNTWSGISTVATAYKKMLSTYGINGFLNYQRRGDTAWKDGKSYDQGCHLFRFFI